MSKSRTPFWRDRRVIPEEWSATKLTDNAFQIVAVAVPLFLVGIPLLFFLWASVWSTAPGNSGYFTLENFRQVSQVPQIGTILYNTVVAVVVGTVLALFIGVSVAILVNKMDLPGAQLISYLVIVQYIFPDMVLALAWTLLAGPQGAINGALISLGLISGPIISVYNEWGIGLVMGIHYAGLVYLLVNGAVGSIPKSMEESGRLAGATPYQVLRRITLSLSFPSIVIAAIFVAALIAQSFGAPLILGWRSQTYVISTYLYQLVAVFPANFGLAGALGVLLIGIVVLSLIGQWYLRGSSEGYQTIVGRGAEDSQVTLSLGKKGYAGFVAVGLVLGFCIVLPILLMVVASFQRVSVGLFSQYIQWTTENYTSILVGRRSGDFWLAVGYTFFIAVVGSFLTMILSSMISYIIVKKKSALSTFLDIAMIAPVAVPTVIIGVAYLWFFLTYNLLGLYGSVWLIIIAIAAREIIYGTRATNSSLTSIGDSLEEAAQLTGANIFTIMRRVYYPLIKPGFFAGFTIAFIHYFKAFTIPIFLKSGTDIEVMSTLLFQYWRTGNGSAAITVATLMVLMIMGVVAAVQYFTDMSLTDLS